MKKTITVILVLFCLSASAQTNTPTATATQTSTQTFTQTVTPSHTPTPFSAFSTPSVPTPGGNYAPLVKKSLSDGAEYLTTLATADILDVTANTVNFYMNGGASIDAWISSLGDLHFTTTEKFYDAGSFAIVDGANGAILRDSGGNALIADDTTVRPGVTNNSIGLGASGSKWGKFWGTVIDATGDATIAGTNILSGLTYPTSDGSSGDVIGTNGSGVLSLGPVLSSAAADTIMIAVRKGSAGTITKGQSVYISGYNVGLGVPEVELSQADSAVTMPSIGLANGSITNAANGNLIFSGQISGVSTSSFSAGDSVYVKVNTAGELTNNRPVLDGDLVQKVGEVLRSHGSLGSIQIFGAGRTNDVPTSISVQGDITTTLGDLTATAGDVIGVNGTLTGNLAAGDDASADVHGITGSTTITYADDVSVTSFSVVDSDGGLKYIDGTGTVGETFPIFLLDMEGTSAAVSAWFLAEINTAADSGATGILKFVVREDDSTVVDTRPIMQWVNHTTTYETLSAAGVHTFEAAGAGIVVNDNIILPDDSEATGATTGNFRYNTTGNILEVWDTAWLEVAMACPLVFVDTGILNASGSAVFRRSNFLFRGQDGPQENEWDSFTLPVGTTRFYISSLPSELTFFDAVGAFTAYYYDNGVPSGTESIMPGYSDFKMVNIEIVRDVSGEYITRNVSLSNLPESAANKIRTEDNIFAILKNDQRVLIDVPSFPATNNGGNLTSITWRAKGFFVKKPLSEWN